LINDQTVLGLVGPGNSNVAQVEIPLAVRAGLPIVGPETAVLCLTLQEYCIYPGQEQVHPSGVSNCFFRTSSNDLQQGQAANILFKSLGLRTVFVVEDTEIYGRELADIFSQNLKRDGGTILGTDQISKDETPTQLAQLAQKIVSSKPDAVFYGGVTSNGGGHLKEQLVQAGFTGRLIGGSGIAHDQQFLYDAGSAANNTYAIALGPDPSNLPQSFIQKYESSYNVKPTLDSASGYDAAMILITAIKSLIKNKPNLLHSNIETIRKAIVQSINDQRTYQSVTGRSITFDGYGDNAAAKIFVVYAVENGQWIYKPDKTITLS
jgi:branched-chain amino acid transport system substrate-binding protein